MEFKFRPIVSWTQPGSPGTTRGTFKRSYAQVFRDLERELRHLGARDCVLQLDCTERDIRLDGKPRADVRYRTPRIIATFQTSKGQTISMASQRYSTWLHNLQAIAMTLESLRAVNRYGVAQGGEQYRGFTALPDSSTAGVMNDVNQAAAFMAALAEVSADALKVRPSLLSTAYRWAANKAHPDRGGTAEKFSLVVRAKEIIEAHHQATGAQG